MTDTNIAVFIKDKIGDAFNELAVVLGNELAEKYGEDLPAGQLAFELMSAQMFLEGQWESYCRRKMDGEQ